MKLSRRTVLATGAAALAMPSIARAQEAMRHFALVRGRSHIGTHHLSVSRARDIVNVEITVDISVRVMGFTAYRYEMSSHELWQGGILHSLHAHTNHDGENAYVTAARSGDQIDIEGSAFNGSVGLDVGTTTYWTPALMQRSTWISTQGGMPLNIRPVSTGLVRYEMAHSHVGATGYALGDELPATAYYTDEGEWVGNTFDARGAEVKYIPDDISQPFAPLWTG